MREKDVQIKIKIPEGALESLYWPITETNLLCCLRGSSETFQHISLPLFTHKIPLDNELIKHGVLFLWID